MQLALWPDAPDATDSRADRSGVYTRPGPRRAKTEKRPELSAHDLAAQAERYVEAAHSEHTRDAYRADWGAFEGWCTARGVPALPASPGTLALYLTHLADQGRKASTIRRARIAIGQAHGHAGAPRPDRDARIRTLERGIARVHGGREEGALPLLEDQLARAVASLGHSLRDVRDRALLLVGFAGAFRCSELAGLNVEDVRFVGQGVEVCVQRSKEDQLGQGRRTTIPAGMNPSTCPVSALGLWMERVGRPAGPLFRLIVSGSVEHARIHPKAVTRAVQRAVTRAGLEGHYSSHSLRGGLATSAYAHGATRREIQLQGRWEDPRSVDRYIQMEHVRGRRNVVVGLL